jgi:genome maintenance exonuclease 1
MDDTDLEEYHSIGKPIKWSSKYSYVTGTRHEDHGTRTYDVNGSRLPSVTTILGATKNQQFLKDWKAKVGEAEADRIKNLSSKRGTSMHKFLEHYVQGSTARKSRCIILGFTLGLLTWYVFTTKWIPL